jgi:hypothetical protein
MLSYGMPTRLALGNCNLGMDIDYTWVASWNESVQCMLTCGLGPSVIMGVAWSGIDANLGLQARVVPACCTGGHHGNKSIIIIMLT